MSRTPTSTAIIAGAASMGDHEGAGLRCATEPFEVPEDANPLVKNLAALASGPCVTCPIRNRCTTIG